MKPKMLLVSLAKKLIKRALWITTSNERSSLRSQSTILKMALWGKKKRVVKWQLFKVIRILFEKSIYFAHTDAHTSWLIFRCVRISGWISTIYKRFGQATESFQGWSGVCLIQTTSIKKGLKLQSDVSRRVVTPTCLLKSRQTLTGVVCEPPPLKFLLVPPPSNNA